MTHNLLFYCIPEEGLNVSVFQVPFEKNCRTNDTCIAELEVDFTFKYVQHTSNT